MVAKVDNISELAEQVFDSLRLEFEDVEVNGQKKTLNQATLNEFLKNKKRVYVQNFESEETKKLTEFVDYLINLSEYKKEIEHYNLKIDFGNTAGFFRHPEPCFE